MDGTDLSGVESLHIVLVERDETTREFLKGILEHDGMTVESMAGIAEALEVVQRGDPDLVLCAYPGGDGSELTAGIRAMAAHMLLPVVFFANADQVAQRYLAIATGADDFLLKPFDPELLIGAIRGRVGRARGMKRPPPPLPEAEVKGGQLRRGEFLAQLGAVLRGATQPWQALMALRLDQGQELAEKLGQAASFELEQALAVRFAAALEPDDAYTLWMEFGFGVLVERDSGAHLEALARELCRRVAEEPFEVRGEQYALTLSIGVALPPAGADAGDPDRWFASAYAAQSIAHRAGGNHFDGVLSREYGAMPPERVLIIREWAVEAVAGGNVVIEFQPIVPLQPGSPGLYAIDAKLRDYRAPLAGVRRHDYLRLAREAGSLAMIDRMSLFHAFEAIEEERTAGRETWVLAPVDLASLNEPQLRWLEAELRRRRAHADGLVIEVDASAALSRPEFLETMNRLGRSGVVIAIADECGSLDRLDALYGLPAGLLRLPLAAIDSVSPEEFLRLLTPWLEGGRGVIVGGLPDTRSVPRLSRLNIGYIQSDALAGSGPRLDFHFGAPVA